MEQKTQKKFFVFQIIPFELSIGNSCKTEKETSNLRSICQQKALRFNLNVGETFFKSTSCTMMNKHDKPALMEIWKVIGTLSDVDCQSVF